MFQILMAFGVGYLVATPAGKKIVNKMGDAAFSAVKGNVDKVINKYKVAGNKNDAQSDSTDEQ